VSTKKLGTSRPRKPANEVITDLGLTVLPSSSPRASACEPYREAIEVGLSRRRNAMTIWQDLVTEHGFRSSYQSVQRFVRKQQVTQGQQTRVVIHTAPGEEAQVDYGTGPWFAIHSLESIDEPGCL
jgi:hypothetical protein